MRHYDSIKRVMVTGGAGFLGSHLCERLINDGHDVLCVDNFYTGRRANIAHLIDHANFEVMRHDVTFPLYVEVDEIYNLACPAAPIHYQFDPVATTKVSVHGAINMLGLAKRTKAKIFQASTSEVYGDPTVHPQKEDYWGNVNPIGPRGVYDEAKRFAEAMAIAYHRYHGIDVKIVRIFNTFGPRMRVRDGRAIPAFISQTLRDEPVTVFGNGKQTRSFCYISDLVEGIYRLLTSNYNLPVNIGNPTEMTILELAETIQQLTDSKSPIDYKPLPVDDPKVRQPDISLARRLLGWEPTVDLEVGLETTIAYFRKKLELD